MFDLDRYIAKQITWSTEAFGPDDRTAGVIDHIKKELVEIEETGGADLEEWADLIILALDGAWRAGNYPEQITAMLEYKRIKNAGRKWPDWRTAERGKAIEHIREESHEEPERSSS